MGDGFVGDPRGIQRGQRMLFDFKKQITGIPKAVHVRLDTQNSAFYGSVHRGKVKTWIEKKTHGFIVRGAGKGDLRFLKRDLVGGLERLRPGQRVLFSIGRQPNGKPAACNVRLDPQYNNSEGMSDHGRVSKELLKHAKISTE